MPRFLVGISHRAYRRRVFAVAGAITALFLILFAVLPALVDKGAGAAVITLGGAGSVALGDDGELLRMPALSSEVVDTTAAGARASAVTVSRLGAQQSIPTRAEVERVFDLDDLVQDGEAE